MKSCSNCKHLIDFRGTSFKMCSNEDSPLTKAIKRLGLVGLPMNEKELLETSCSLHEEKIDNKQKK